MFESAVSGRSPRFRRETTSGREMREWLKPRSGLVPGPGNQGKASPRHMRQKGFDSRGNRGRNRERPLLALCSTHMGLQRVAGNELL